MCNRHHHLRQRRLLGTCVNVSYHGECHAVDLVFVFGLVLSEGTVPKQEREDRR